jgi:flagellar motor protein MotB
MRLQSCFESEESMKQFLVVAIALAVVPFCAQAQSGSSTITLHPGLTVNFSVYGGIDSTGRVIGDYNFVNQVTSVNGGYSYNFWFTDAAANSGSQSVSAADRKTGTTLREFWPSGDMSAPGYISCLAVSDKTFADLKVGKSTPFAFDGPDSPVAITKVGEQDLRTLVNEQVVTLHTIKVTGSKGGTFWILDSPGLPMLIRGETKWKWMVTSISDSGTSGGLLVAQLKKNGKAVTHAVLFAFNSSNLDREAKPVLDSVAQYLQANPKVRLEIQGHTDNIGGAAVNLALSQSRAESVKSYLVSAGIDASRLTAKGYGLTQPVASNITPEGRAQNRRVVFKVN